MTSRKQDLYTAVLEEIKVSFGENFRPTSAVCDYEKAIENALIFNFPDMEVRGCAFHYSNDVYKHMKTLRLVPLYLRDSAFRQWARLVMGLPLLPAEHIVDVYKQELEKQTFDCVATVATSIRKLKAYVNRHWLQRVGAVKLSVFSSSRRTNNETESYHRWLRTHIPPVSAKANYWVFLEHLNAFIDATDADFQCLANGLQVRRAKTKQRVAAELKLDNLKGMLRRGELAPFEFLTAARDKMPEPSSANVEEDGEEENVGGSASGNDEEGEAEKENGDAKKCDLCQLDRVSVLFLPCTHAKWCQECAADLAICPACDSSIVEKLEIIL